MTVRDMPRTLEPTRHVARLSPFVRHHINMLGRYSFSLPDLPGGLRPLRAPDAAEE